MRTDLVIVGAGPAGLGAAAEARTSGLDVVVVDERPAEGGSRAAPPGWTAADAHGAWLMPPLPLDDAELEAEAERAARLRREAEGATFVFDGFVWGLFGGFTLAVSRAGATFRIDAERVVLATGSYVVRPAFPGHELDAVLTPAGLVRALEGGALGGDAVVAVVGDGEPADRLLAELARRGVAAVLLTGREHGTEVPTYVLAGAPSLREAGDRCEVEAPLVDGRRATMPVDALVVAGPVVPASELAAMVGCRHRFVGPHCGFAPLHGPEGATSVAGLYLAGSLAGTLGADEAERSGRAAGLAAAVNAGRASPERLEASLAAAPAPRERPDGTWTAATHVDPDSQAILCRCIGTRWADVAEAVRDGARSLDDVKRRAKAGMGPCQGRDCGLAVSRVIERVGGVDVASLQPMRVRPPIRPLTANQMFEREERR